MSRRVVALDFDGVIAESAHEAFVVAARAFLRLRPDARLRADLESVTVGRPRIDSVEAAATFAEFVRLIPLGNRAEDYGVALTILDSDLGVRGQAAYDELMAAQDHAWLQRYHTEFYRVRDELMRDDPRGWRALQRPYTGVPELLHRRADTARLAIATAKDRASTRALLVEWGLDAVFPDRFLLDKEAGRSKRAHLEALQRRCDVPFADITFVEDKVSHLESVAALGVRCVLAGWGYNGPPEHARAVELGFVVATLGSFEADVFGR